MKRFVIKSFNLIFCSILIFSVFFFISGFESYRPKTLPFVGSILEPFREEGIHIQAHAYSPCESIAYLDRNLLANGLQPIQLTIQNNTAESYFLSDGGVDLPTLGPGAVASKVSRSAIPRSIALKVASIFFWPFIVPSTIDSILTIKSHYKMRSDYFAKSIKEEDELILPYSTVHRVIFVRSDQHQDSFTLYLQEEKGGAFHPFDLKVIS